MTTTTTTRTVPVADITLGENVRGDDLGDVEGLAASIERVGLLNPLTVNPHVSGTLRLIAGHRRLAAVKSLGWTEVPVVVLEADESEHLAVQLVENLQREDLDPIAEANGLATLVELLGGQRQAAAAIGRSAGHVSKRLSLRNLAEPVRDAVASGEIAPETAYQLSRIGDQRKARTLAGRVLETGGGDGDSYVRSEIARTLRNEADDKALRSAARKLNKARPDGSPAIVAAVDVERSWRYLDGFNGLPVDYDEHMGDECHRRVLPAIPPEGETPDLRDVCTDPARHDDDGASSVKLIAQTAEAERAERRQAAQAAAEREAAEAAARADRLGEVIRGLSRSSAMDVLVAAVIAELADDPWQFGEYVEWLAGVLRLELPAPTIGAHAWSTDQLASWLMGLDGAKRWRAAVAGVTYWRANTPAHRRTDVAAEVLATAGYTDPQDDNENTKDDDQ